MSMGEGDGLLGTTAVHELVLGLVRSVKGEDEEIQQLFEVGSAHLVSRRVHQASPGMMGLPHSVV